MDKKNRLGQKFGRLLVIGEANSRRSPNGKLVRHLICKCDCGEKTIVNINNLRNSSTKSCGCFAKEGNNKSHEMSKTRFYHIWNSLNNRKGKTYKGILPSREWKKFLNFKKDMYVSYLKHCKKFGEKETTIDRINNKLGYFKENCRWATWLEQNKNRTANYVFDIKLKHKNFGIYYFKWGHRKKRWVARIHTDGRQLNLGYFKNEKEARKARRIAEVKYNKIYA